MINKKTLKLVSILFSVVVLIAILCSNGLIVYAETLEFAGGMGTEEDPYLIETKEHLDNVRNHLNSNFKMIADIEFTNDDFSESGDFYNKSQGWIPIGTDYNATFNGVFNGNNHTIKGLRIAIDTDPENQLSFIGLFGYGNGCLIENLNLIDTNIIVSADNSEIFAGSIIGRTDEFGSGAAIVNCSNEGIINIYSGSCHVGGIAGGLEKGTIEHCNSSGIINASYIGYTTVGGIVGYLNEGDITDCNNVTDCFNKNRKDDNVEPTCFVGGIAGGARGNTIRCSNSGKIESSFDAGGIICDNWGLISNCKNTGNISASYRAGGISAVSAKESEMNRECGISDCSNEAKIETGFDGSINYRISAGGICGQIQNGIIVSDCLNKGNVLSSTSESIDCESGGIVGYNAGGTIKLCANSGDVTVKSTRYARGAGIVGCNCGGEYTNTIDQCFNSGDILSPDGEHGICAGIAGDNYSSVCITNCFNIGSIKSSSCPGGIVGLCNNRSGITVERCYNIGVIETLTPDSWIGGEFLPQMENCFYLSIPTGSTSEIIGYAAGEGLTPADMEKTESFSDFDFDSIWTMTGNPDYPYPELQSLPLTYTKNLRSISIQTVPSKTSFLEQKDSLVVSGGKLLLVFDKGVREIVDMTIDMVSGFDNTKIGKQMLTVQYDECEDSYEVEVIAKSLLSIEVTKKPVKLLYLESKDVLDVTGGEITLYYDNGTSEVVNMTADMISGFDNNAVGEQVLTVSYREKETAFPIKINAKKITSIAINSKPIKLTYIEGESLDLSGMVVTAYYDNGTSNAVTNYTVSDFSSMVGMQKVTISYEEMTASFNVQVKPFLNSVEMFSDVSENAWYKSYIDYAVTYGLLNGTGYGRMAPDRTMTRAEFVQVLANLAGVDTLNKNVDSDFEDVPPGQWFAPAVKWASENKIVNGIGSGMFAPNATITREQMCTMLIRYIEKYENITLEQKYEKKTFSDDSLISDWAKKSVYECQKGGLVNGVSATEFAPQNEANRAAVATIMARFHKQYIR